MLKCAENAEKKIWIKLLNNKYFYENFSLNFSLQNKQFQQIYSFLSFLFPLFSFFSFFSFLSKQTLKEHQNYNFLLEAEEREKTIL